MGLGIEIILGELGMFVGLKRDVFTLIVLECGWY